jgi:hypothetical protein
MKTITKLLVAAAGFAGAAQAATIHIYKQPNFTGGQVTLNSEAVNLASQGILDQASSLVLDGSWELCSQPNFAGDCRVLSSGRYATLEQSLNHRIESARPVQARRDARGEGARDYAGREHGQRERYARGDMEIFPGADFRGRPQRLETDADSLDDIGRTASSMRINEGTWQICTQPNHEGFCRTFEPGRYASLGRFDNQIASARLIR